MTLCPNFCMRPRNLLKVCIGIYGAEPLFPPSPSSQVAAQLSANLPPPTNVDPLPEKEVSVLHNSFSPSLQSGLVSREDGSAAVGIVCITVRTKFISNYPPRTSTLGREKISQKERGKSAVINGDSFQCDIKYWLIFCTSVNYMCES